MFRSAVPSIVLLVLLLASDTAIAQTDDPYYCDEAFGSIYLRG